MDVRSVASARMGRRVSRRIAVLVGALVLGAVGTAGAQEKPVGTPVRWDQARVTKMSQDLYAAVHDAREAVRHSPLSQNPGQRTTYYELQETMRLVENTSRHLRSELEKGKGADETRAVFERISSLRFQAEEQGRRALVEAPVIDELVKAGAIHNQMLPYYYGKR
jgi:hypothetical protein